MPDQTAGDATSAALPPDIEESGPPPKWNIIGPGLLVAATGVGAIDLVATLVAGAKYGYGLLWAVLVGCIMKIVLVEGAARYTLATGNTIFDGWKKLGLWTTIYFGPYIVIWGFVYGSAAMSGTGLPAYALTGVLDVKWWGLIMATIGLGLVWFDKYALLEKVMAVLVGLMFIAMVGAAALALWRQPNFIGMLKGLVPWVPPGGVVNVLSLAGGVGGTITLAAYGYWLREKKWVTPRFMKVMRIDNSMAYVITGIFVISTLIVGATVLHSKGLLVKSGDEGMLELSKILGKEFGNPFRYIFLTGFFSAAMTSLLGVWNGVSMMFADFMGHILKLPEGHPDTRAGGKWYRAYILWLTFPPLILMFSGAKPVGLILAYGVLGSLFMPFMAVTGLWLLNSKHTPKQWRNNLVSNIIMGLCALAFAWLALTELQKALAPLFK